MRMRKLFYSLALSFLSCLIVFSGACINASALSGGRFLSANETLQLFGTIIPCTFMDSNDQQQTGQFEYQNSATTNNSPAYYFPSGEYTSDYLNTGNFTWVCYKMTSANTSQTIDQITVDVTLSGTITDSSMVHTVLALSSSSQVSSVYQSPSWDWNFAGTSQHLENSYIPSDGSYAGSRNCLNCPNSNRGTFVEASYDGNAAGVSYCSRACFYGNHGSRSSVSTLWLYIGCPYVDLDSTVSNGIPSGGGGADVDLEETNDLLTGIQTSLSSLVSRVASLFEPDIDYITQWKRDVLGVLTTVFQPYQGTKDLLDDFAADLFTYGATNSVQFPGISVPGTSFSISARAVSLVPSGMESIISTLRTMFDILATIWVINMIGTKIKAVLVGETVAEIDEVDYAD